MRVTPADPSNRFIRDHLVHILRVGAPKVNGVAAAAVIGTRRAR